MSGLVITPTFRDGFMTWGLQHGLTLAQHLAEVIRGDQQALELAGDVHMCERVVLQGQASHMLQGPWHLHCCTAALQSSTKDVKG